jgi:hypothetical protein
VLVIVDDLDHRPRPPGKAQKVLTRYRWLLMRSDKRNETQLYERACITVSFRHLSAKRGTLASRPSRAAMQIEKCLLGEGESRI